MFENIRSIISSILPLSEEEWGIFENAFQVRTVPKKTILSRNNAIARELFFINKGLIRLYYINKRGEEITAFLFKENLFASCYESFLAQRPSIQEMETLEDCELLSITHDNLQYLYKKIPAINIVTRVVADQRFINGQKILSSFILKTPLERYTDFLADQPDLLQRVPLQYIASFLGITPVSLSRIRKRIG